MGPIRIETGRFERPRLAVFERLCPSCDDGQSIENEEHFIFYCSKYSDLRQKWIDQLQKSDEFSDLETSEKFRMIFDKPENIKSSAQFIINIFYLRSKKESATQTGPQSGLFGTIVMGSWTRIENVFF